MNARRIDRHAARRCLVLAAVAALVLCVLFLAFAPEAWAQAGNDVGRNLGRLLRRWGGQIYSGVVAIVGVVFLINRRYTELAIFLFAAVVVAWLVFSPDQIARAARGIGREIFG